MVSAGPSRAGTLAARLEALAEHRHRDPAEAHAQATALLSEVAEGHDAWPIGQWVLGLTQHELAQPAAAVRSYRAAARAAEARGDARTEALARASMAISLLSVGDAAAAEHEIGRADELAPRSARGLVDLLVALVLQRTGRLAESLSAYGRALGRLRRNGDDANVARLLVNRGTLHAYQGRFPDAMADLAEAEERATALELWMLAAMAAHNLGFTLGRAGQVPGSLAAFDRAEAAYVAQGSPPRAMAVLAADRCEVFLGVGLARDAVEAAQRALAVLNTADDAMHRAETQLLLARAHLASGDVAAAQADAASAADAFRSARRAPWAAVSDYVGMQAEILATEDSPLPPPAGMLSRTRRIARLLEDQGWPVEAMHVRTFLARVALARRRPEVARRELSGVARARRSSSAQLRVEAWHATALLRLAEDDRAGAKRALRRGLAVVDDHRAALGASELRSGAAAHGADLARLGLRMAVADGRPMEVLRWAERWRAGALRHPAVAPPEDAQLTAALQELREARSALREATLEAEPSPALAQRVARLEGLVRSRTMQAGPSSVAAPHHLDVAGLRHSLGSTSLVELVALEGRLLAVTLARGRARLHDLGASEVVDDEQAHLRAGLRRQLLAAPGTGAADSAARAVAATSERLDRILLGPLQLPDEPVVIVPTGGLHGLCWAALPSLIGRPVSLPPSAELWHRRGRQARTPSARRTALVAGPDLEAGDAEVEHLATRYRGALVLRGRDATVAAAQDALQHADLVHLAAHGSFRADAPLFSSLRLTDGPLTVYEIERLRSVPDTLVLPACDAARSGVRPGDELLGTAAALLGLGVASVVAPLLPVPDAATAPLMLSLHARLREGDAPSVALARAAADAPGDPVARAFVCIGANEQGAPARGATS